MADNKPKNQQPTNDDSEQQQSEALKRAIMKLREQGMLSHVPDELLAESDTDRPATVPSRPENKTNAPTIASRSQAETTPQASDDDLTLPARKKPEMPTVATTSDDGEAEKGAAGDDVQTETLLTGWDDLPQIPPEEDDEILANWDDAPHPDDMPDVVDPRARTQESQQIITVQGDDVPRQIVPSGSAALTESRQETPWALQQFFDGEIDLERELLRRFPSIPLMTQIRFRTLGKASGRHVATLQAQDGSAALLVDTDSRTKVTRFTFSIHSMLSLRYEMHSLSQHDRLHWLEIMRREQGGLAFFWGAPRWQEDYLICTANKRFTTVFAFSPHHYDAAVRLIAPIARKLLEWLEDIWLTEPEPEPEPDDGDDNTLLSW